jgi:NAD kinase
MRVAKSDHAGLERKVVLVTRPTRVEELVARFNTVAQAKFYVEHLGADFADYEREYALYAQAKQSVEETLKRHCRVQVLNRAYLPSFLFAPDDIVVALGQDGVVANTLKYLDGQPLVGVNPDPHRFDGVLLPFEPRDLAKVFAEILAGRRPLKEVTMAKATLTDGQSLYAVNDLFIGPKSHTSARYELALNDQKEVQSSSGIIVSTGLGSTAWYKSIVTGSCAVAQSLGLSVPKDLYAPMPWDAPYLQYAVREPFPSIATQAKLICGRADRSSPLTVRSMMAENGVIFSDGIEQDFLSFNSGALATISVADRVGLLVH